MLVTAKNHTEFMTFGKLIFVVLDIYRQIGVDFALKVLNWDADTIVRLQLWDIAGMISLPINKEENSREGLKIRYTGSTLN